MSIGSLILVLLLTLTSSALLVWRFLVPARRTVAGISLFVFWLCNLIVPVQCLALLNLAGLTSFLRVTQLFLLNGTTFVCVLALCLFRLRSHQSKRLGLTSELRLNVSPHVALGLLIVLCVYGILSVRMAISFPDAWDPVVYHYPVALRWLQEGTMRITSASAWQASLPGNVEVLDLLVLSTGHERLLGCVQWPGVLILLLACVHLSRRLANSGASVWPILTIVLMIPMVATQAVSGAVDLFGSAVLFGSLALILEYCDQLKNYDQSPRPALLVAAGLGCGLAVGAKPVFWLYAALLFLNILLALPSGRLIRRGWLQLALFLAGVAVPSVFWFARATACTGNPFYPLSIHVGTLSLSGVPPSAITSPHYYLSDARHWAELFVYPWTEWKRSPGFLLNNYGPGSGLGGGFATFAVPGVMFASWLAIKRRRELRVWLVNLVVLGTLWWFLLQKVVRFGLPLFILAAIMTVPFFDVLEQRATRLYRLLYVLVFMISACLLTFEPLYTIVQVVRYGSWSRAAYWLYPNAIDKLPTGSRILSLCDPTLNFALAGSGLTNRVIPSWERPDHLTADFLRLHQVDYVVEKSALHQRGDLVADKEPPLKGLEIYVHVDIPEGGKVAEWWIWSTRTLLNDSSGQVPRDSGSNR